MPAEVLEVPEGWEVLTEDKHLIKKVTTPGTGEATPGKGAKVEVHYTGRLVSNGEQFDSSRDRSPFSFKLGAGQVIKGWDEGVATMKLGEVATLRMASDYGYGDSGSGAKIPGGAALEFDVELLDWNSKEDITHGDKGVMKEVISAGVGHKKPSDCTKVVLALKCTLPNGDVVEEHTAEAPLRLVIGEEQAPAGLEKAIMSMVPKEKAKFDIKPQWAYGSEGCEAKKIPADATLHYELELLEMDKEKETWNMSTAEKIEFAKTKKEQGNVFFKEGRHAIAFKRYEAGANAIKHSKDWEEAEQAEANNLNVVLNLNMAMVKTKQEEWKEVVKYADEAINLQPSNLKAHFRRGVALGSSGSWVEAESALKKALEIDPENKEVKRELARLHKRIKAQDAKDRKMYQRMFK